MKIQFKLTSDLRKNFRIFSLFFFQFVHQKKSCLCIISIKLVYYKNQDRFKFYVFEKKNLQLFYVPFSNPKKCDNSTTVKLINIKSSALVQLNYQLLDIPWDIVTCALINRFIFWEISISMIKLKIRKGTYPSKKIPQTIRALEI